MLSRFPLGVKFMWLVTENGFFNIVQSDDDADKGLLTIKGRVHPIAGTLAYTRKDAISFFTDHGKLGEAA